MKEKTACLLCGAYCDVGHDAPMATFDERAYNVEPQKLRNLKPLDVPKHAVSANEGTNQRQALWDMLVWRRGKRQHSVDP